MSNKQSLKLEKNTHTKNKKESCLIKQQQERSKLKVLSCIDYKNKNEI